MELGLSLGENSRPPLTFLDKSNTTKGLDFCITLGLNGFKNDAEEKVPQEISAPPLMQLDLLPHSPVPRNPLPWLSEHGNSEAGSSGEKGVAQVRGFDVNRFLSTEEADDGAAVSSPNSTVSSFQLDFSIYTSGNKRDLETAGLNEAEAERTSCDDDENGSTRKKLRLSKEQSAFLEESFKEHNTLNPKQKQALAMQLNLRPRQVEVWFQNRRARTKLKQTEVDCEYLKRCCDTLTEENRRLQKEIQELRALKTSHPYYMQLPATTLTMCPSCERVATTASTTTNPPTTTTTTTTPIQNSPRIFYPFSHNTPS